MVDFRRVVTALAVLALLTGFAVTASAQVPAFVCVQGAAVPPLVRAEGVTELVGDIVLNCSGGTPVAAGVTIPTANFDVFIGNANVTSRIISSSITEALLLVDEPVFGAMAGAPAAGCGTTCVGGGAVPNVFQGVLTGPNRVTFYGVPINPPGTTATRIFRITNIRVNANAFGVTSGLAAPNQVLAYTSISGSTSLPVTNLGSQIVGYVLQGLTSSLRNGVSDDSAGGLSVIQCVDLSTSSGARTLRFTEGFATSFKTQGTGALGLTGQTQVGNVYNTESGLTVNPATLPAPSGMIGVASYGTRLKATFRNIPTGVNVYVSLTETTNGSFTGASSSTVSAVLISGSGGEQAVNPAGTVNAPTTQSGTSFSSSMYLVPLDATGTGQAVWEITEATPLAIENVDVQVRLSFSANPNNNTPPAGVQGTVTQSFAPTGSGGSWISASSSLPVPRFVDLSSARNLIIINLCRTTLLFPFVSAADGFDTGLSIANTSIIEAGATGQTGTCTMTFFGSGAPSPAAFPAASTPIPFGTVGVNVASAIAPGFVGYAVAVCNFQYAHGFAFVQSSVGYNPSTAAMGYLALVLGAPSRPLNPEALNN
jgi:hypothetical protein